jgi:Peptidase family M28
MRFRLLLVLVALASCAHPSITPVAPEAYAPPVDAGELRKDLYVFASDSFAGRETGTPAAMRAARFIAERLTTLGLEPAGDSLYYQRVPLVAVSFGSGTRFTVNDGASTKTLNLGSDLIPLVNFGPGAPLPKRSADGDIIFAGYGMMDGGRKDYQGPTAQSGKVIVVVHGAPQSILDSLKRTDLTAATRARLDSLRQRLESQDELGPRIQRAMMLQPKAIILMMSGGTEEFFAQAGPELLRSVVSAPGDQTTSDSERPLPMVLFGIARAGSPLLPANWPQDDTPQLLQGRHFAAHIELRNSPFTAYNVVGIVRGTDPRMNKTYVAFGAHYDHIGVQPGMSPDSIANGADDDGSGSVTMLALARSFMQAPRKRSSLFVWHVGEEKGLLGSAYFTDHPTVPIDSIVAQLNADMVGRRGGPSATYDTRTAPDSAAATNRLYIVGPSAAPNGQSKVLGTIVDSVNAAEAKPMTLDRQWDTLTDPERIYYRSDHYNYARKGIPIVFFTTGLHEDYHKVGDEPQKIDYEKMARIANLLRDVGTAVGDRAQRPR